MSAGPRVGSALRGRRRAVMRDHGVQERPATPLELFFDLCFVVAVAFLAAELHHGIAAGHVVDAAVRYALLFVPIWWAWMSYTWFATAYSHDDTVTRLLTFAQMAGVLGVAAAVPSAFSGDLAPFAVAYALMRFPLVAQWVRAAVDDPPHRAFALTYALGSVLAQALWVVGALLGGSAGIVVFAVALAVELGTPVTAVRRTPDTVFHPRHVAERYGLFTIIVLGETVLAGSVGLRDAVQELVVDVETLGLVGGGLVIAFALWWVYFEALSPDALVRNRRAAFAWGYGHYVLFAAVAAVGAGLQAQLELGGVSTGAGAVAAAGAGLGAAEGTGAAASSAGSGVIAGAVALCLLSLAWLRRTADPHAPVGTLVAAATASGLLGLGAALGLGPVLVVLCVGALTAVAAGVRRPV